MTRGGRVGGSELLLFVIHSSPDIDEYSKTEHDNHHDTKNDHDNGKQQRCPPSSHDRVVSLLEEVSVLVQQRMEKLASFSPPSYHQSNHEDEYNDGKMTKLSLPLPPLMGRLNVASDASREWLETFEKSLGDLSFPNNNNNDDSESGGSCNEDRNPPLIITFALAQWKDDNESKDE